MIVRLLVAAWLLSHPCHAGSGVDLAAAAREQIGVTKIYDPGYVVLDYPGGDVPRDRGVCTATNIGLGTREHDALFRFERTGHYRWPDNNKPAPRDAEDGPEE